MIGVLVADDHPIIREGIKRITDEFSDMQVVAEAENGIEALDRAAEPEVDVVLLDISMPGPGFLQTLDRLGRRHPRLPVLVLSVHPEEHYAIRAFKAGAAGYVTKDHSPKSLARAIRRAHAGGRYVSEALAEKLAGLIGKEMAGPRHSELSEREYQVMLRLAGGRSVKQIAERLCLSPKTVSTYRKRLLEKMGFGSNAELIRYAIREGLID